MAKTKLCYNADGTPRSASRQKAIRSRLSRVQLRSVTTGEVVYRSHIMRIGTAWSIFFKTVDRVSREEVYVDLVTWGRFKGSRLRPARSRTTDALT